MQDKSKHATKCWVKALHCNGQGARALNLQPCVLPELPTLVQQVATLHHTSPAHVTCAELQHMRPATHHTTSYSAGS